MKYETTPYFVPCKKRPSRFARCKFTGHSCSERRAFLPVCSAFFPYGLTRSGVIRNQGSERRFVFVTEFVFALPFALTLHAFDALDPETERSHQFARLTRRNVARLYLIERGYLRLMPSNSIINTLNALYSH